MDKCKDRLNKFAVSLRSKMRLKRKKKDDDGSSSSNILAIQQCRETAKDPGIVGYDEDFTLHDLSVKSWNNCVDQYERQNNRVKIKDEALLKPYGIETITRHSWDYSTLSLKTEKKNAESEELVSPPHKDRESRFPILNPFRKEKSESDLKNKDKSSTERIITGEDNDSAPIQTNVINSSRILNEPIRKYARKSREDLILMVSEIQSDIDQKRKKLKDLDDSLDHLLLGVMESTLTVLHNLNKR